MNKPLKGLYDCFYVSPELPAQQYEYLKKEYVFLPSRMAGISQDQVMLLDETKFFQLLLERGLADKYERFMLGPQTDLYRFLTAECCLSLNDIRAVSRYHICAADALDADHSLKEIHAFVRGADGRVYIPGSSVKGALRTAILTDMILSDTAPQPALGDTRKGFPEGNYLYTLALKRDRDGRAVNDAVNSILRGISISDSLPVADSCMMLAGKTDALVNGETHQINLCRECICPGTVLHFKLTLDQSVLHQKITAESLKKSIRTFDAYYETMLLRHFTAPRNAAAVSYTGISDEHSFASSAIVVQRINSIAYGFSLLIRCLHLCQHEVPYTCVCTGGQCISKQRHNQDDSRRHRQRCEQHKHSRSSKQREGNQKILPRTHEEHQPRVFQTLPNRKIDIAQNRQRVSAIENQEQQAQKRGKRPPAAVCRGAEEAACPDQNAGCRRHGERSQKRALPFPPENTPEFLPEHLRPVVKHIVKHTVHRTQCRRGGHNGNAAEQHHKIQLHQRPELLFPDPSVQRCAALRSWPLRFGVFSIPISKTPHI